MDDGTWLAGLSGIDPEMLAIGLRACVDRAIEWPPSLPEFKRLCCGVDDDVIESLMLAHMPSRFDRDRMTRDEMRRAVKEAKDKAMREINHVLRENPRRYVDTPDRTELLQKLKELG